MIVTDLDGTHTTWKISKAKTRASTSSYHKQAIKLINKLYPLYSVCEEVPINVQNNLWLYIDIYLPTINMALEVHGEQHYKFNPFFHKTRLDFVQQRHNDRLKREWCELNNVAFISLPYDCIDQWQSRIEDYEYGSDD